MAGIAEHPDAGMPLKQQLFSWLQAELQQKVYFDYGDFGYSMVEVFESLAIKTGKTDVFLTHVDRELAKPDDRYSDYNKNFYTIRKIEFLRAINLTEDAEALIKAHLDVVELRRLMVNRSIEAQDYEEAKSLINGGIAVARGKDHPGTLATWQKELFALLYWKRMWRSYVTIPDILPLTEVSKGNTIRPGKPLIWQMNGELYWNNVFRNRLRQCWQFTIEISSGVG
ncbi:MAG: hypothetical protein P0Y49_21795 [Candidatus Pedobacter colombiensis]|uniref:Uncharacterized protein n=1 Tax=Candidatus Pedobacter colombiensis TaxID=3121371 RepID=A0AAJ6B7E0_9SPHI|nr:hypothetical protein [Pedobacter sp.]WEK19411.1 MAG: hypothetical protein P0Y49_21795 [Pedobacter sp.]